ncbi:MAG: ABC transporter ATP-binding protein [Bacilli bacterium]|nr:ABC transporter ATP-binding protein [Bacilli bacterium]
MKITLKDLSYTYKGENGDSLAIANLSLNIKDGEMLGLLGPSGCGKTTLLNLISGLLSPDSGKICFGEDDVASLPPEKRGIGYVFQNHALYPHMSVYDNIKYPLLALKDKNLNKEEMDQRIKEIASLVQVDALLNKKPNELSGGEMQRVAIARALVKKPHILLLDEPLSSLDAYLRKQTAKEIRRIQKETKITTIFVTHDQREAMDISDEVAIMNGGALVQIGKPSEVMAKPASDFVRKFLLVDN